MDGERDEAGREGPPLRPHKRDFPLSSSTKIRAYTLKLFHSFQDYYNWQRITFIEFFGLEREKKLGRCTYMPLGISRVPGFPLCHFQRESNGPVTCVDGSLLFFSMVARE